MATELLVNVGVNQIVGGSDDNQQTEDEKQAAKEEEAAYGPLACFVWCCSKSSDTPQKCQFSLWVVMGILAPVFYGTYLNMDEDGSQLNWGYFLCCALSILMSIYSTFSFSEIFRLKKVIDDLVDGLKMLLELRKRIQEEVANLVGVRDTLAQIETEQSMTNAELRAQEKQFRDWLNQRKKTSKSADTKSDDIRDNLQHQIIQQTRDIEQSEKNMLFNAYYVFETMEDDAKRSGLNRDEFEGLINALPLRYKTRFRQTGETFDDHSGGDDVIDHDEFAKYLNKLLTAEVKQIAHTHGIQIPGLQDGLRF